MSETHDLVIAGGGIAGLSAALAAVEAGMSVAVLERAPALSEVGAGLQLGANAMKVLAGLGLGDAIARAGHAPPALELRDGETGQAIFSLPAGPAAIARWGQPHVNIRRAALQQVLVSALAERAPGALRLGCEAADYSASADGATIETTHSERLSARSLIVADGVGSALRGRMLDGRKPTYTGHTALRAMVPATPALKQVLPDASIAWTGRTRHAVTYYLHDRDLINFVGVIEQVEPEPEGWHNSASLETARTAFSGFAEPVTALLSTATEARSWGLYDRPPPHCLQSGPVAMIGDAAVPMPPFMAQGASFAMECAWAAVWSLKTTGGFEAYERALILRAGRILDAARRNGNLFHGRGLPALAGFLPVKLAAGLAPGLIRARFDWVYNYDVTAGRPLT